MQMSFLFQDLIINSQSTPVYPVPVFQVCLTVVSPTNIQYIVMEYVLTTFLQSF